MNIAEFLSQRLPEVVKREVVVGVSSDDESRKDGDTTKVTVSMKFDTSWTVGDLIDRLTASNSPKVSVQAILRKKKDCPKRYEWAVNKSGTRSTVDSRETAIAFFESKGLTRVAAEFMVDHAAELSTLTPDAPSAPSAPSAKSDEGEGWTDADGNPTDEEGNPI